MSVQSRWRLSLKRLYKVSIVAAIAFVPGWLAMGFLNAVAYGLAAAAGAHPTGRGNAAAQAIAGAVVAFVAAIIATIWIKPDAADESPSFDLRYVIGAAGIVAFGLLLVRGVRTGLEARAARKQAFTAVSQRGLQALDDAGKLAWEHYAGRQGGLAAQILNDASASSEARLAAGLMLVSSGGATPQEVDAVGAMMRAPAPLRLQALRALRRQTYLGLKGPLGQLLKPAFQDPDPEVRIAAATIIGSPAWRGYADSEACLGLMPLLKGNDGALRARAVDASDVCDSATRPELIAAALADVEPKVRLAALSKTVRYDTPLDGATKVRALMKAAEDPDAQVRDAATRALTWLNPRSSVPEERIYALSRLAALPEPGAAPSRRARVDDIGRPVGGAMPRVERELRLRLLVPYLSDGDEAVRAKALDHVRGVLSRGDQEDWIQAWPAIAAMWIDDAEPRLRRTARMEARRLGPPAAPASVAARTAALRRTIRSADVETRLRAAEQLAWLGDESAVATADAVLRQGDAGFDDETFASAVWSLSTVRGAEALQALASCPTLRETSRTAAREALADAYVKRNLAPPEVPGERLLPDYCPAAVVTTP